MSDVNEEMVRVSRQKHRSSLQTPAQVHVESTCTQKNAPPLTHVRFSECNIDYTKENGR